VLLNAFLCGVKIQLHDKTFVPFIGKAEVQQAIASIADAINTDYADKIPTILPVLDGAFMFAAALAKQLTIPAQFSFIKYKSYHNTQSTGQVSQLLGLDINIEGQHVLIVEDIIDTGLTVSFLIKELEKYKPASVCIAALLTKPEALKTPLHVNYKGIDIANRFVVGYGMDYNGLGRNLDEVYVVVE
jgi:hypoxanthine phosphoribosyltransferase